MTDKERKIDRRSFLRSSAAMGAGLAISPLMFGQSFASGTSGEDDINVGLIGAGAEGQVLMNACLKIPGIRFKAVCDIWTDYNLTRVSRTLTAYRHENNAYEDYREMLEKETDLDAVIIATPDFWHSRHTVACLEAGLDVYCEKEMSNTVEGAKAMLDAAKSTGKLLQIGHQRRSNPRYIHCYENYIKTGLLGQITTLYGQWNRGKAACEDLGWPENAVIDEAKLKEYGYDSMQKFRNWRWYKGLGGGPIVDLGSHQIDIFSWFVGSNPKSVMASGGIDYWKTHDWYDNVMAIYEYPTKEESIARAFYQTITTNSAQGYFEQFMGLEGTLVISEAAARGTVYREAWVEEAQWQPYVDKGVMIPIEEEETEQADAGVVLDVRESPTPPAYDIPVTLGDKPYHQPHLENFFDAVRGKATLTCPAEIGYETAVTVLKVNEAVEAARRLEFNPEEFEV